MYPLAPHSPKKDHSTLKKTILATAISIGIASYSTTAFADTFTVTSAADSGDGTLRAAITQANDTPGADEIIFADGISAITLSSPLKITESLNIIGPGLEDLTISNAVTTGNAAFEFNSASEIYEISNFSLEQTDTAIARLVYSSDTLTIKNAHLYQSHDDHFNNSGAAISTNAPLHIESSLIEGFKSTYRGGAITSNSNLTIMNSTLSGNTSNSYGGAINVSSASGELTIHNSTLSGNISNIYGGAIHSSADTTITNSLLSGNTANNYGGVIHSNADTTITNCTLSNNNAHNGGAIYIYGKTTINNSTLSGNTAYYGGAISVYSYNDSDNLIINNSTISGYTTNNNRGEIEFYQYFSEMSGDLTLNNSIVITNPSSKYSGAIDGNVNVNHSFIGNTYRANINEISEKGTNILGTNDNPIDPLLGPLEDNGGLRVGVNGDVPLLTHAVLEKSPVISAGDITTVNLPENDQRGAGYERIHNGGLDLGAVESEYFINLGTELNAPIDDLTVSLGETIFLDLSTHFSDPDDQTLSFSAIGLPNNLSLSIDGQLSGTMTAANVDNSPLMITITASDGSLLSSEDNFEIAVINLAPVLDTNIDDLIVDLDEVVDIDLSKYFSDPESQELIFSATRLPDGWSLDSNGQLKGTATFVNAVNSLNRSITLTASDGELSTSDDFDITINIEPFLDSTVKDLIVSLDEEINVNLSEYFINPWKEELNYTTIGLPENLTLDSNWQLSGTVTSDNAEISPLTVTITVNNGGDALSYDFDIIINSSPAVIDTAIDDLTVNIGDVIDLDLSNHFNDPDSQALSFTATGLPNNWSLTTSGQLSGTVTSSNAESSLFTISLTVSDGLLSTKEDFEIKVNTPVVEKPDVDIENPNTEVENPTIDNTETEVDSPDTEVENPVTNSPDTEIDNPVADTSKSSSGGSLNWGIFGALLSIFGLRRPRYRLK